MSRRKFDGVPTEPMFDMPHVEKTRNRERVRSVAFVSCPSCSNERIGLVRVGAHLVVRAHTYRTWSDTIMPCHANGVALCTFVGIKTKARCGHD